MRELTEAEIDEVSGGALNLATGAGGAFLGGLAGGAHYAVTQSGTGNFSWSGFAGEVVLGTASGFLIGSGVGLFGAAVSGAAPGAAVAGTTLAGTGIALQAAAGGSDHG